MDEKKNQLLILKDKMKGEEFTLSLLLYKKELVQINAEPSDSQNARLGSVYVGKVKNIVKNINAAFIEIAGGRMCYLPLAKKQHPIFANGVPKDNIVIGDELLVQVERESVKTKAPTVTTNINITGKYVVLTHGDRKIGISAKIKEEEERKRLRDIAGKYANETFGLVVRTNSRNVEADVIEHEIQILLQKYERISRYAIHFTRFSLVEKGLPNYLCDIRDNNQSNLDEIVTDDKEIYEEMKEYLSQFQQEDLVKLRFYQDEMISLKNIYSITSKIEKAFKKNVWLKSGGYLVIEPTEALTVIDINTGKAVKGRKNEQETFYKINMEASVEIARQIRLRNMSGIILIDFIDMKEQEKRDRLMEEFGNLLSKDPVKTALIDMTRLNLVEVTRKKVRKPLWEQINLRSDEDE